MKSAILGLLMALFLSFMGCTAAPDRILMKEQGEDNRCHMKLETYGDRPCRPNARLSIITGPVMNGLVPGVNRDGVK